MLSCLRNVPVSRESTMIPARMLIGCVIALAAVSLTGCPQKPATLTQVTGKVFYKGVLLNDGVIVFSPDTSRVGSAQFVTRAPVSGSRTCPPCVWPARIRS